MMHMFIDDYTYSFDQSTKECKVYPLGNTYVGAYTQTTCTVTPKWTNPDPPTWKTVTGNC